MNLGQPGCQLLPGIFETFIIAFVVQCMQLRVEGCLFLQQVVAPHVGF